MCVCVSLRFNVCVCACFRFTSEFYRRPTSIIIFTLWNDHRMPCFIWYIFNVFSLIVLVYTTVRITGVSFLSSFLGSLSDEISFLFVVCVHVCVCVSVLDKQGVSRRVGFVRFDNNNTAQTAINALDGIIPDGEDSPISVKVQYSIILEKKTVLP